MTRCAAHAPPSSVVRRRTIARAGSIPSEYGPSEGRASTWLHGSAYPPRLPLSANEDDEGINKKDPHPDSAREEGEGNARTQPDELGRDLDDLGTWAEGQRCM